jgi:hypothetical protein
MRISLNVKTIYLNQQIAFHKILTTTGIHDLFNPLSLATIANREAEAIGTFDDVDVQSFQRNFGWFCFDFALCGSPRKS